MPSRCRSGIDLQPIAYDSFIRQQPRDIALAELRNALRLEALERFPIILALAQNRVPAQPGLRSLERDKLEPPPIVMHRHAPLFIVVSNCRIVTRPRTPHRADSAFLKNFAMLLTSGAGVTPAQGGVEPTAGSTFDSSYAPLALLRSGSSLAFSADFSAHRRFSSPNASSTNAFISATSGITRGSAINPKYRLL